MMLRRPLFYNRAWCISFAGATMLLLACDSPVEPVPVPTSIGGLPDTISIPQFGSQQLMPTVYDEDGKAISNPSVTYESWADYRVAVSSDGLVESLGPSGDVYVAVSSGDARKRVLVRVHQVATSIFVDPLPIILAQRGAFNVDVWILDATGIMILHAVATFTSNDPMLFSVDDQGVITSVGPAGIGTLRITHGALSETIDVTITPSTAPLGSLRVAEPRDGPMLRVR